MSNLKIAGPVKVQIPKNKEYKAKAAIWMVGIIGGHLGRKRDGMPGTECIWRGLQRLDTVVEMYAIFKKLPLSRIRQFYVLLPGGIDLYNLV